MRNLGLIVTLGALATGGSAYAQVKNINSSAGNTVAIGPNGLPAPYYGPGGTPPGLGTSGAPPGASFDSYVHVNPNTIEFESHNTTRGASVQSFSSSTVSFDINAPEGSTFGSTITPAGLGFYLADTSGGCLYTDCPQVGLGAASFSQLADVGGRIGEVGFNFSVTSSSAPGPLYSLSGSLAMTADGRLFIEDNLGQFPGFDFVGSGPRKLKNFSDAVGNDVLYDEEDGSFLSGSGLGYRWDATDFDFDVPFGAQTLTYTTEVYSRTAASCIGLTKICLIAYSGFGDPVGRGGGNDTFARSFGPSSAPRITGIEFTPTVFDLPTFVNGRGSFGALGSASVPEPATWMAMIMGFALLGSALRRRRAAAFA